MVGGWKKGHPWVCSIQTLLKQETYPGDREGTCFFLKYLLPGVLHYSLISFSQQLDSFIDMKIEVQREAKSLS